MKKPRIPVFYNGKYSECGFYYYFAEDLRIDKKANVEMLKNRTWVKKVIYMKSEYPSFATSKKAIDQGFPSRAFVHRLYAEAFLPRESGKDYINHKDGNKFNYSLDNLEWCTIKENQNHAIRTGLIPTSYKSHQSKLTRAMVICFVCANKNGLGMREIALKHNVSFRTVQKTLQRKKNENKY